MDGVIMFALYAIISSIIGFAILKFTDWAKGSLSAKISVKITGAYVFAVILLGACIYLIGGILTVVTEEKEQSIESRMEEVDEDLNRGSYYLVSRTLLEESCYEPEFDYAWERLFMNDAYQHYLIRKTALEELNASGGDEAHIEQVRNEMELYKQELLDLCENSTDPKNALYVQDYQRKLSE